MNVAVNLPLSELQQLLLLLLLLVSRQKTFKNNTKRCCAGHKKCKSSVTTTTKRSQMEENRDETPKKKRPQHKTMQKKRRRQQRVWLGRHSLFPPHCTNLNACTHHICFSLSFFLSTQLSARWDNSTYFIPSNINGLNLELTDYTRFQLVDGIFNKNNRVNHFKIVGTHHEDQVELTPHAFRNNKGGFPEILIVGVQHVFIREQAFSGEYKRCFLVIT